MIRLIYASLILSVFSFVLLLSNYRNKITWYLFLATMGIVLSLLSSVMYISKTGIYFRPTYSAFSPDYDLYVTILNLRFSLDNAIRLYNAGMMLFITGLILTLLYLEKSIYSIRMKTGKLQVILMLFTVVFSMVFYDPWVSYSFYVQLADSKMYDPELHRILLLIVNSLDLVGYMGLMYIFFRIGSSFTRLYDFLNINFIKKQIASSGIILGVFILLFFSLFFFIDMKKPYFLFQENYHHLLPGTTEVTISSFYLLPLVTLATSLAILVLVLKYKGFRSISILKRFFIEKNLKTARINYRNVFHSFKNTLFVVKSLTDRSLTRYSTNEGLKSLEELNAFAESSINSISKLLDSVKDVRIKPQMIYISQCIEDALRNIPFGKNIEIRKNYSFNNVRVYADRFHLTESLHNILQNAVEAIAQSEGSGGCISISVYNLLEWVIIQITDNGCGIKKTDLKKVFKPFFSTKSRQENWGIGLHYTSNVVQAHSGFIDLTSQEDLGTTFEILLPNVEGGMQVE